MRRTGGPDSNPAYHGIYDGTRGAQRPLSRGRRYPFSVLLCGHICRPVGNQGVTPSPHDNFARTR